VERRREPAHEDERPTALPKDYLALVVKVFAEAYAESLDALADKGQRPELLAGGALFANEVLMWVSLTRKNEMAAVTVHASMDFDLERDPPSDVERRLAACVDSIGMVFSGLFAPDVLDKVRRSPHAALEDLPAAWSPTTIRDQTVFVRVDSANPGFEQLADDFLAAHEPAAPASMDKRPTDKHPRDKPPSSEARARPHYKSVKPHKRDDMN
jgi:hypothetical protein